MRTIMHMQACKNIFLRMMIAFKKNVYLQQHFLNINLLIF